MKSPRALFMVGTDQLGRQMTVRLRRVLPISVRAGESLLNELIAALLRPQGTQGRKSVGIRVRLALRW